MPDDIVEDTAPDPTNPDDVPVVDEVVPDPDPPADDAPRPPWVDEILEAIQTLPANVVSSDPVNPDIPGDGEPVADDAPVSKPWTHRGFFSKD